MAINFYTFLLVFLMFSLIVILYKLDNYYTCLLGKSVMHILKLNIMFDTLEQLVAEILVIL